VIAIIASLLTTASFARADGLDRPQFRNGLWYFERTVEYVRAPPNENVLLSKTEATRCVDPNVAMKATFASADVGSCRSASPQTSGNQYIFSNRCDFLGPVRTEITAESEIAYTEINVLFFDPLPKRDMVVARRVGDCEISGAQNLGASASARKGR
jgi:hypothetical protein